MIQKFNKQVLCPEGSRSWVDCGQEGELVSLQERLEATATWNKHKFGVPEEIREMAVAVAKEEGKNSPR